MVVSMNVVVENEISSKFIQSPKSSCDLVDHDLCEIQTNKHFFIESSTTTAVSYHHLLPPSLPQKKGYRWFFYSYSL
jgi:hypothetical protein